MRALSIAMFGIVGTTITGLVHYYLWARLVRDPRWPSPWDRVGTGVIIALALLVPLTMFLGRVVLPDLGRLLAWPGFVWMGTMFILLCVLAAVDALKAVGLVGLRLTGTSDLLGDPDRRQLLRAGAAVASAAVAGVLSTAAVRRSREGAEVKTVEVTLPRLPRALDGLTVAQLTDIHIGSTIGRDYVQRLVEQTNAFKPDVIAITGDLVDGSTDELGDIVREFGRLRADLGIFFVTGNHEYYSGVDEWLAFVSAMGIRVLRNERVEIGQDGHVLDLAGVDDFQTS